MSILQNALDSIELGLEDFDSKDPKRLKSAVRNFYAGVLLLFKHKLADLSADDDEALLKSHIVPVLDNGTLRWKGRGGKTVNLHQIKDRFEGLGISVNWKAVEGIHKYRNNIEHYFATTKQESVRGYITSCFAIVSAFVTDHLQQAPRDLLGAAVWDRLLTESEVYKGELKKCTELMFALKWPNETARFWIGGASCSSCGSDLVRPDGGQGDDAQASQFVCSACGESWSYDDLLNLAGSPHDTHQAARDGDGPMVGTCPNCSEEGYDAVEEQCVFCGACGPYICIRCDITIPMEELTWESGNLCGYCFHMTSKDD